MDGIRRPKRRRRLLVTMVAGLAVTAVGLGVPALAAPGNNGTIKVDDQPFDTTPGNEPHVGCLFQVDFYGYDEGSLTAKVTFRVQPPTGRAVVLTEENIFIGEDPAGGGTDLDAERTYDLGAVLAGTYEPQPNQGFHVKLTVNAQGSRGADTKYKTFWVEGCSLPPI